MTSRIYLRPLGLAAGRDAEELVASKDALALAGGPLAFTGARLIDWTGGNVAARYLSARDLAASTETAIRSLLSRITQARPAFAGLAMDRPRLMGIVNVTPDSFSDGGAHATFDAAIAHGRRLIEEGADILDIGGESTRPGAKAVPLEEERARVMPVVSALAKEGVPLSIDTRKAAIMREATGAGAAVVNDVSALSCDAEAPAAAARSGAFVILMHSRGDPKDMQRSPSYEHAALEVYDELEASMATAEAAGIAREKIAVDPGLGFAKSFEHNIEIVRDLALFHGLGVPILVGASRKGFIGHISGVAEAGARVHGSIAVALAALARGVQLIRAHDVADTRAAMSAWRAVAGSTGENAS